MSPAEKALLAAPVGREKKAFTPKERNKNQR
jgi:hypothetical protein